MSETAEERIEATLLAAHGTNFGFQVNHMLCRLIHFQKQFALVWNGPVSGYLSWFRRLCQIPEDMARYDAPHLASHYLIIDISFPP